MVWWVGARRPPRWRTCRYGRSTPGSKRPCKHVAWIRQRTARAVSCIYAQSLQVNPPNPAVCHGTLRLPLRGGNGHVPRTHIDPISLYALQFIDNHGCWISASIRFWVCGNKALCSFFAASRASNTNASSSCRVLWPRMHQAFSIIYGVSARQDNIQAQWANTARQTHQTYVAYLSMHVTALNCTPHVFRAQTSLYWATYLACFEHRRHCIELHTPRASSTDVTVLNYIPRMFRAQMSLYWATYLACFEHGHHCIELHTLHVSSADVIVLSYILRVLRAQTSLRWTVNFTCFEYRCIESSTSRASSKGILKTTSRASSTGVLNQPRRIPRAWTCWP